MARNWKIGQNLLLVALLGLSWLLAACSDTAPGDKGQYVQQAINAASGGSPLPAPTVDPGIVLSLQVVIVGGPEFYTAQIDTTTGRRVSSVPLFVINNGLTTVWISSCEGEILQRKEGNNWVNVASVRPCGSTPQKMEMTAGGEFNLSFEFVKSRPYPNQSYDVPGNYRLVINYSPACPPARNDFASCTNVTWTASTEFTLKPAPDGAIPAQTLTATPKK